MALEQATETLDVNATAPSTVDQAAEVPQQTLDVKVPESTATVSSTEALSDVKPKNVYEAVKQGLAESAAEKASASSSTAADKVADQPKAEAEGESEATGDDDLIKSLEENDPKSRAASRIRELVSEVKAYEEKAQNFDSLSTWVNDAGLAQDEFVEGLNIMREMKRDPFKAYEMLMPYMQSLQQQVGEVMPDDIQQRVEQGLLDEESAKELVKARLRADMLENRRVEQEQEDEAQAQQQVQQQHIQALQTAASTWEASWKASDPDYEVKKSMVKAFVVNLMNTEGVPTDAKGVVAQCNKARAEVESHLKRIAPPRQPVNTIKGTASTGAVQAPKSSLDAARLALQNTQSKCKHVVYILLDIKGKISCLLQHKNQ